MLSLEQSTHVICLSLDYSSPLEPPQIDLEVRSIPHSDNRHPIDTPAFRSLVYIGCHWKW
jgi:hypothetical protein